jgi:hypothetical protein
MLTTDALDAALAGEVRDSRFHGSIRRATIDLGGGVTLAAEHQHPMHPGERVSVRVGEHVVVSPQTQ